MQLVAILLFFLGLTIYFGINSRDENVISYKKIVCIFFSIPFIIMIIRSLIFL